MVLVHRFTNIRTKLLVPNACNFLRNFIGPLSLEGVREKSVLLDTVT